MSTDTLRPAWSVDELKAAWHAVLNGEFRPHTTASRTSTLCLDRSAEAVESEWSPAPGERTVAVLGATGAVGASTVALALATSATGAARVLECCSVSISGTASATTAELGLHPSGWQQGKRHHVLIERGSQPVTSVDQIPAPSPAPGPQLSVIDVGWDITQVLTSSGWLNDATRAAHAHVVVTAATVPGMRRVETTLEQLGADRPVIAVLGPRRKKWPRGVEQSVGPLTRACLAENRCVEIPSDRALAVTGLDSRPLPGPVLAAARLLLDRLAVEDTTSGADEQTAPNPVRDDPAADADDPADWGQ